MKPEVLAKLHEAADFPALTRSVLAMCEPFGPVHSFRLIHNRCASRVACFIELESPEHHATLIRALGANGVGGEVCLDIPVRDDFERRGRVVSLATADSRRAPVRSGAHAAPT
jgi:hypothetical protein